MWLRFYRGWQPRLARVAAQTIFFEANSDPCDFSVEPMLSPARSPSRRKALGELSPNRATPKSERKTNKLFSRLLGNRTLDNVIIYDDSKENKGDSLNLSKDASASLEKTPPAKMGATLTPTESKLLGGVSNVTMAKKTPLKKGQTPNRALTPKTASKKTVAQVCKRLSSSQYEIAFPRGSMGLELEPVITSSEKAIGVKVKDFYYGMDYQGLDPVVLEECISIGDVISTVNDVNVLSMPFHDILQVIKTSRDSSIRQVVFKNISASWEAALPQTENDNSFNDALTPQKPLSTMKGTNTESPAVWKVYPGSHMKSPLSKTNTPVKAPYINTDLVPTLTISPKAVRALSMAGATTSSQQKKEKEEGSSTSGKNNRVSPLTRPITSNDLTMVLKEMGASLVGKASKVGQKILQPFTGNTEMDVLVSRKHELLCELSQSCVLLGAAQEKENDLTSQLDDAKQQEIEAKKALFLAEESKNELKSIITHLEEENRNLTQENHELLLRTQHHSEDWSQQQEEKREFMERIETLENEVDDWKAVNEENKAAFATQSQELLDAKSMMQEMSSQLTLERDQHMIVSLEFEAQIEKMSLESQTLKNEMENAMKEATEQLVAAEHLRDELVAENEYLKERTHTDKNGLQLELTNMKTSLQSLQQLHTDELVKKEEEMHACLNDWNIERKGIETERDSKSEECLTLTQQMEEKEKEMQVLKTEIMALSAFQKDAVINLEIYEKQKVASRLGNAVLSYHNDANVLKMQSLEASFDNERRQFADMNLEKMAKIDSLRSELNNCLKDNESLSSECSEWKQKADMISHAARETNEVQESAYRQALIESEEVQINLKNEMEEVMLKIQVAEETIMDQLAEKEKLLISIKEKEESLKEWQTKAGEKEAIIQEMEMSSNNTFDKYASSLESVNSQIKQLETQCDIQRKDFEERLKEKEGFIKDHIASNQTLQEQLNESLLQKNSLEQEVHDESEKYKVEKEKVRTLENEVFTKHTTITEQSQELENLKNDNVKLKFDLEAAQMAYETLQINHDTIEANHNEVSRNLTIVRNEQQEALCKHELATRKAETSIVDLQKAKDSLMSQLKSSENIRVQMSRSASVSIKSLRTECKQAKNDVADLQIYLRSVVSQLGSKVEEMSLESNTWKKKYDQCQSSYNVLLKNSEINVTDLEDQLRSLTEAMNNKELHHEEKLQLSFTKHSEVESLLEKAYVEHSRLEESILSMTSEMEELRSQHTDLKSKIDEKDVELLATQKELQRLNTYSEEQKFAVVHLRGEFSRLSNEIPILNEAIERLENEIVEKESSFEKQRDVLLSQHVESERRWSNDNEKAIKKVEELSKKLQKKEDSLSKMTSKHENVLVEMRKDFDRQLQNTEREMEKEKKTLLKKAESAKDHHEKLVNSSKEYQKQCAESVSKLKVLESEINSMKKELMKSNKKIVAHELVVKEKEEENSTLRQLLDKNNLLVETTINKYQCEAEEIEEESKKRETALVEQRDELMKSLQTQHDLLTSTIHDRDHELKTATLEHTSAVTELSQVKEDREALNVKYTALKLEMANLQAEYSRLSINNNVNSNANNESECIKEVKELLKESIVENKALHKQRKDLADALQLQQDAIDAAQTREQEFSVVKMGLESQLSELRSRVEGLMCNHTDTINALEGKIQEITRSLAEANSQTMSLKQSLLEKQTELTALQIQYGNSLLKNRNHEEDKDKYNEDKENLTSGPLQSSSMPVKNDKRAVLGEIQPNTNVVLSSDSDLAVSDISSNSDSHEHLNLTKDNGMNAPNQILLSQNNCSSWHDSLIQRCLDMHECLTFAIAEYTTANVNKNENGVEGSDSLVRASMALQEVHEQALMAPWLPPSSLPVQSLPPAHVMITQLGLSPLMSSKSMVEQSKREEKQSKQIQSLQRELSDTQLSLQALTTQLKAKTLTTNLTNTTNSMREKETLNGFAVKALPALLVPGAVEDNINGKVLPNTPAERVYMHMEELMELLEDGPLCMALQNSINLDDHSINHSSNTSTNVSLDGDTSLVLGGEVSTWQSFYSILQRIVATYHTKVIAAATSMENSPRGEGSPILPEDYVNGVIGGEERGGCVVFNEGIEEVTMDTSIELLPFVSTLQQSTLSRETSSSDLKVLTPIARLSPRVEGKVGFDDSAFSSVRNTQNMIPTITFQPRMSINSLENNQMSHDGAGDSYGKEDGDNVLVRSITSLHSHTSGFADAFQSSLAQMIRDNQDTEYGDDLNNSDVQEDSGFWNISAQSIDNQDILNTSNSIDNNSLGEVSSEHNASFDFASP